MKKTQQKKSLARSRRNFRIALWALVALLIVGQFALDFCLWRRSRAAADNTIVALITQAVDGLSHPLPLNAETGRGYVASAKLTLPTVPAELSQVLYNYSPAVDSSPAELHFTTNLVMSAAKSKVYSAFGSSRVDVTKTLNDTFEEVPNLQACARGVSVLIDKPLESTDGLNDLGSKKLADGRTVYIYQESGCNHDALDTLAQYVKQIDSY